MQLAYIIPAEMNLMMMMLQHEQLIRNVTCIIPYLCIFKRGDIRMKPVLQLHKLQHLFLFFCLKTLNLKQVLRPASRQVKIALSYPTQDFLINHYR